MTPGPKEFREHVVKLLTTHRIAMTERHDKFDPLMVYSVMGSRSIQVQPVVDAITYAIALHEIGHIVAQRKAGIGINGGDLDDPMFVYDVLTEEHAAWEWAESVALDWPVEMAHIRQLAMTNYLRILDRAKRLAGI